MNLRWWVLGLSSCLPSAKAGDRHRYDFVASDTVPCQNPQWTRTEVAVRILLAMLLPPILLFGGVSTGFGQIPYQMLTLTTSDRTSVECSVESPCDGATAQPVVGTYLFRVFAGPIEPASEAWFALEMPSDYSIVDWSVCQEGLIDGDPDRPAAGLHFRSPECFVWDIPLVQYVIECPTPGRVQLAAADSLGGISCPGDYFETWYADRYVDIGDFCGRLVKTACWNCPPGLAGHFDPTVLEMHVPWRTTAADTIDAWSPVDCSELPECGGGWYDPPCFGSVTTETPWLSLVHIDTDGNNHRYQVVASAQGLAVGRYHGRIDLNGSSTCCESTCMEVKMEVLPPSPVLGRSWGDVKILMRGK